MKPALISNRELTLLRKLRLKKYRHREQLFIAEGPRSVGQIIHNKRIKIKQIFFDEHQHLWKQKLWESIMETVDSALVSEKDFEDICDTANPQGVIALCHIPEETSLIELARQTGVIVASDAVRDPGNMGTIIRTASWFGAKGFLLGKGSVDLFNPKVVRATAGSTGTIAYASVELQNSLNLFEKQGWQIILLDAGNDSVSLREVVKGDKMMIVIGNEANGIDESLFTPARKRIRIDSLGNTGVESLNAAIAASVALYEIS